MVETIQEPGVLERLANNVVLLAGAVATLTERLSGVGSSSTGALPPAAEKAPAKPRGRPVKGGDDTPVVVQTGAVAATLAATEVDPFEIEPKAPVKALELTDVRAALIAYQKATSPEKARLKLKEFGDVDSLASLTADKFQTVVDSLK